MGPSESRSVCYGKLLSASALSIKVTILLLPLTSDEMVCARHQIGAAMVTGKVSVAEEEGGGSTDGAPERTRGPCSKAREKDSRTFIQL